MALFCMIFGIVIFVAFLFGGYAVASMMVADGFLNMLSGTSDFSVSEIFVLPAAGDIGTYVACILVMGFFGLMIGMGVFMNGMILRRLESVENLSRRSIRLAKRAQSEE